MSRLLCHDGRKAHVVVCDCTLCPPKQHGRVNSSVVEVAAGRARIVASDCRTHGRNRFSLLKSAVAVLRPLHRKVFQHRKSVGAGFAASVPWGAQCSGAFCVAQGRMRL